MCGVRPRRTYSATVSAGGVSGFCGTNATSRATARRPSLRASLPVDQHLALVGGEAGERAQRRGLPRAVRPDQRRPASRFRAQREPAHGRDRPEPHPEVARLDHRPLLERAQDDGEERRAEERGDDADRQLGRREDGARDDVREHEEARAGEQRERDDRAVARRDEEPDRVRDDDPDERDQAAHRHGRGRPERGRDDDRQPRASDVDPEARRLVVAEAEDVEHAPVQDEHERAHRDVRRADRDVVPGRGREAAEQPRVDVLQLLRVLLLHERLHRRREGRHRHAGEHERTGHLRGADRAAERVRDDDRGDRTRERGQRHRPVAARRGRGGVDDRERRAEPGAAGHAEQIRVAERVPEHALIRGAGDGEHPADERGEHHPRRPDCQSTARSTAPSGWWTWRNGTYAERRAEDRADPDVDRPDREPDRERGDQEGDGDEAGAEADAPCLDAGCRLHPSGRRGHQPCFAIRATVRANSTIRGPQREATSSFASTTRWC